MRDGRLVKTPCHPCLPPKLKMKGIVVVHKFGIKSGGDPNFSPVDKTGLFMKKGIMKELS